MSLRRGLFVIGRSLRETGQALDRLGARLQGDLAFQEEVNRHRRVMNLFDKQPAIAADVFVAPNASVIGNVELSPKATVWFGSVLRGDVNAIKVGEQAVIGDRAVVHVASGNAPGTQARPTTIGKGAVVGQGSILHACTLEDASVVDAGSIVSDGAVVGKSAWVGPGSLVAPGAQIPAGQYWEGTPAKYVRDLTDAEKASIATKAEETYKLAAAYEAQLGKDSAAREAAKNKVPQQDALAY